MKSKCLWLVYSFYHLLNFFSSDSLNCAANIACGTTENRLPSTHGNANKCCCCCCCFEYRLKFLFKSSYQKCLYIFVFAKFSYPQRNPVMKIFKTKKKPLYHLGNFNSPLTLQLPPSAGPKIKRHCLRRSDQCR